MTKAFLYININRNRKWWLLLLATSLDTLLLLTGQTVKQFLCGCDVVTTVKRLLCVVCHSSAVWPRTITRDCAVKARSIRRVDASMLAAAGWAPAVDSGLDSNADRSRQVAGRIEREIEISNVADRKSRDDSSSIVRAHWLATGPLPLLPPPWYTTKLLSSQSRLTATSDSARQTLNERARDCDCVSDSILTSLFVSHHQSPSVYRTM